VSWQAATALLLLVVLGGGLAWYELSRPPARVVSLVATMSALAVVGRIAFAAIPNVKPTTDIVLFAGWALGPAPGFAVGALTGLVSNVFFGQGPWTPWQMTAWGLVGVAGGLLGRLARGREPRRLPLALICALAGFGYGALLDLYQWTLAAQHDLPSYLAVSGTSFPYNLAHAVGNFGFALLIGPVFLRALRRYRRRFEVRWERPAVIALLLAAVVVPVALTATPPKAQAASTPQQRALAYLEKAQNTDGGFGGAPGQSSSSLYTGWAALGLAAGGVNPRDAQHPKLTPISFTRTHASDLKDIGELERTMVVLRASGLSLRNFAGRDLVAQLAHSQKKDGSWEELVDHTAFGVFGMRAGGASVSSLRSAVLWIERQQNKDGGFGFGPAGGSSDVDDTGSVLQALAAGGRKGSKVVRGAISYLRHTQNADGGFGQSKGAGSNAQSTAWAVQGLVAVGRNPDALRRNGHTPISYIESLVAANGSVRYSRTSVQTPVWVTAEALVAMARKSLPLGPVARKAPVRVAAAAPKHSDKKTPAAKKKASRHAAAKPKTKLHGGPIATIAQPTPVPATPAASVRSPAKAHGGGGGGSNSLWWVVAAAVAIVLGAGGYLGRKLRRRGPSTA
jgi:prenyltransferase beta subunit